MFLLDLRHHLLRSDLRVVFQDSLGLSRHRTHLDAAHEANLACAVVFQIDRHVHYLRTLDALVLDLVVVVRWRLLFIGVLSDFDNLLLLLNLLISLRRGMFLLL